MRRWRVRLGAFVLALAVTACGGVTQPSRFYLLATPPELERERSTDTAGRDLSVGVGPVVLPPYLDRPQIVTQASRHELDLAEFDQWAEPLEDNFTRVLAENLSVLLATDRIVVFPWRRSVLVDYQIAVNVIRFDAVHGESMLVARWNVFGTAGRELLYTGRSSFRRPVAGAGFEAIVASLSGILAEFSREVAAAASALAE